MQSLSGHVAVAADEVATEDMMLNNARKRTQQTTILSFIIDLIIQYELTQILVRYEQVISLKRHLYGANQNDGGFCFLIVHVLIDDAVGKDRVAAVIVQNHLRIDFWERIWNTVPKVLSQTRLPVTVFHYCTWCLLRSRCLL